jgi:hypothetical protein
VRSTDRIRTLLTTFGRAAAPRGERHHHPASQPPRGLMNRCSFAARAQLYTAGESELCNETTLDRADRVGVGVGGR